MRLQELPGAAAAALAAAVLAAACSAPAPTSRQTAPQPSVRTAAGPIQCLGGDHGLDDVELGWGFCYPGTWKFRQRLQPSSSPRGVDSTFDIIVAPPTAQPDQGLFAFLIIGTYETEGSASLAEWTQKNLGDVATTPIQWGNAKEALRVGGPRPVRVALTPHHVVVMDIRAGEGNLDLEAEMAKRLPTWRFDF